MLLGIQADVKQLMKLVFSKLRSSEEREISVFVASKGGPDNVLNSDSLLLDLMKRSEFRGTRGAASGSEKLMLEEVRRDLAKDLEVILAENSGIFYQKFEAQQRQIEQVHDAVLKEGDRVINTIISGPHDRIVNKVRSFLACDAGGSS